MKISLLLLAAIIAPASQGIAEELRPTPTNRLTLEVEKTGLLRGKTHMFVFGKYRGTVDYNGQKPQLSRV